MENHLGQASPSRIKFPKKFLKIALFPLSLSLTFFVIQNYYNTKLQEVKTIETELKKQVEIQLVAAKKMDEALSMIEGQLATFDSSHTSLFNAIIDIEGTPQNEAFLIRPIEIPVYKGSSIYGELEHRSKYVTKKLTLQNNFLKTFLSVARDKETMMASIPAVCPIYVSDLDRVGSGFGMRKDPIDSTMKMHKGIDIAAPTGTKVYAAGSGKVIRIASSDDGYGNCIVIEHGFGFVSRYAHLSGFKIKEGDEVKKGDLIGLVGSTGRSTGPHLHYEIEKDGEKIDPKKYIKLDLKGLETYD
jgi:murein DD-endopeptidase MepM/ murein hydrolase activator NlpD